MLPALDVLKEYMGLMQEFPELVEIHRGAMRKVRDADKMKEEGRIDVSIIVISYVVIVGRFGSKVCVYIILFWDESSIYVYIIRLWRCPELRGVLYMEVS